MTKAEIEIISSLLNYGSVIVMRDKFKYVDRLVEIFPIVFEETTVCGWSARHVSISDSARRFIAANSKGII